MQILPEFVCAPTVYAVGDTYQIMVPVKSPLLFWAEVGGRRYYDHSNGIIRSDVTMHRVTVKMNALDKAGCYKVGYRKIIERKPYFSEVEEPVEMEIPFRPVPYDRPLRIYHLSDTHGNFDLTSACAKYFGDSPSDLDLLILNGDLPDHSGKVENFSLIFRLCAEITRGEIPVIFSRGNHDTRGVCAEKLEDYTPTDHGKSYFTFRLGPIWGMVLDCAEDKDDSHEAYGHCNCCHEFREEETDFIREVIAREEWKADGVKYRLLIAHNPFTYILHEPFDIEREIYDEWAALLEDTVRPQALICGHLHTIEVSHKGGRLDTSAHGQICPVIIGAKPGEKWKEFYASAITLDGLSMKVVFNDSHHNAVGGDSFAVIE